MSIPRRLAALGARLSALGYCAVAPAMMACGGRAVTTSGATAVTIPAPDSSGGLLGARRIAALPAAEREAWTRYVARSDSIRRWEQDSMARELRAAGREKMVAAPDRRTNWSIDGDMTDAWFASDSSRALADVMLTWQTPAGGWSKHVDYAQGPRKPGTSWFSETDRWTYIGTLDNGSTTEQLRFLARGYRAHPDARYRDAVLRGVEWLLAAQMPSGCWPQVFPLDGGYRDAATFNDDAIVNVLKVFRDIGRGDRSIFGFVPPDLRASTAAALARGVDCLVDNQVTVEGRRTAWGQQHDPLTRVPVGARSYEHPSLSGRESAGVVDFLMTLPSPDGRVVEAVHSAVDWFNATAIRDVAYEYNKGLRREPGAGPIWARMVEIGTNRPIFSNRDGRILYDYEQLTDRRTGYGWFGTEPASVLKRYETWSKRYPRAARGA